VEEGNLRLLIDTNRVEFTGARDVMAHALATTPDDRINWSPSPTARTPVQQVAHAAAAVAHLTATLDGRRFAVPTPAEADLGFRAWERQFTTREEVLSLLARNGDAFLAWLDALTPDRLESSVALPFDLGRVPVRVGIAFPALHTRVHAAQIDYIQTIYGDHDWHLPPAH